MKVEGLDDDQLRREMVPSKVTMLGLVKHLTAVEHGWFAVRFAQSGEDFMWSTDDDLDADWRIEADETTEEIVEGYVVMCKRSRSIEATAESLDDAFDHPQRGRVSLRWVMLHMIEETARHNGHADIMRELIDGVTGD